MVVTKTLSSTVGDFYNFVIKSLKGREARWFGRRLGCNLDSEGLAQGLVNGFGD